MTDLRRARLGWGCGFLAWVSYLNISILICTLAVALFNASKDDIARNFAYLYAGISIGILVRILLPGKKFFIFLFNPPCLAGLRLRPVPAPHHHDSQT
jgi:hypothetical protein